MKDNLIDSLCEACIRYCNGFLAEVGEGPRTFKSPRTILNSVSPSVLIAPNLEDLDESVIHMEQSCDWEVEHGMEWVIRGNKLLYVGSFTGEDHWAKFLGKDSWNYA
jgi:hypothetical protein